MPKIKIAFSTVFFFALLCVFRLPKEIMIPAAAAFIHELGHITAILLSGNKIREIVLYPFGAEIRRGRNLTSYTEDIFTAAAGPAANIAAAAVCFFSGKISLFFINNIILAAVNLLPIKSLDGGAAAEGILLKFFSPHTADLILRSSSFVFIILLWIASVYFLFYTGCNFSLFLMCVYLFATVFLK